MSRNTRRLWDAWLKITATPFKHYDTNLCSIYNIVSPSAKNIQVVHDFYSIISKIQFMKAQQCLCFFESVMKK